jgi:hypothetical protein
MNKISSKIVARLADSIEFAQAQTRTLQRDAKELTTDLLLKMQRHARDLANETDNLLQPLSDDAWLEAFDRAHDEVERRRSEARKIARARKERERERSEFVKAFPELASNFY